jgi:hemerythrin-like domain-containing protein
VTESGIFQALRADHRRVMENLDAIEARIADGRAHASGDPETRRPTLSNDVLERIREFTAHLARQFDTHLAAEDEVLYPALEQRLENGAALIAPLHVEHVELRAMLETLAATLAAPANDARDEQIAVQVRDLVDLLRIHIRKEETLVFGVAERIIRPCDLAELEARRASWENRTPGTNQPLSEKDRP